VPKLFHLRASPRRDSVSAAGAELFISRFKETHPGWDIDTLDIWRDTLPQYDVEAVDAKYARQSGRPLTQRQSEAQAELGRMVVRLSLAERVVISTPMWNFGIPYKFKQWIDMIVQPGLTFSFDPKFGYSPLLKDRPTLVIMASGSDFVTGMNRGRTDLATPYLREVLGFIGLSNPRFVSIGPTNGSADMTTAARELAFRRLRELAPTF
jgi:FMN-dependent NADH-azoreductase